MEKKVNNDNRLFSIRIILWAIVLFLGFLLLFIEVIQAMYMHCDVVVDGVQYCYVLEDTIVVNEEEKTIVFKTKSRGERAAKQHELSFTEYTIENHYSVS